MSASDVKVYMPVAERKVNVFGYSPVAGDLLATMHGCCFLVHVVMFALTLSAGYGKPMEVSVFRVKPSWTNTGRNGYGYDVVEAWELRIDVVTALFFGASASFHFVWVFLRVLGRFDYDIWKYFTSFIDDCFCPWYATTPRPTSFAFT